MALSVEINPLQLKPVTTVSQYTVNNSLRFRASASAYLGRTPSSATNRTTWTWSGWVKRGSLTADMVLFQGYQDASNSTTISFNATDSIAIVNRVAASNTFNWVTSAVYHDSNSWYHIVVVFDTTQATSTDRIKLYVNGVQVTAFGTQTTGAQNATGFVNNNISHNIGRNGAATQFLDGYIAEVNFVDGQALAPTDFCSFDSNNVWQPKAYTGTYGTNGFYLPFTNTTSLTTLVADSSGNSNNWTANNISLTAGATYDSMIDSPTVASGASNYCVLNPVNTFSATITNANLQVALTGSAFGTFAVSSGKWYWEVTATTGANTPRIGIYDCVAGFAQGRGDTAYSYIYNGNGDKRNNSTSNAYGATYTSNDVIGVALDLDAGTVTFYKNGVSQGVAFSGLTSIYAPEIACTGGSVTFNFNAGQSAFAYTPPANHKALNAYNLTQSLINGSLYNASTLYTGTGATLSVSNSKFKPDIVWMKGRSGATDHAIYDSVRGATLDIGSNLSTGQTTQTTGLTSFDTSGFTVGTLAKVNTASATYVSWQWKAGNGTNVTNTNGSITSTVSADVTSGCSVVTYTGTGAAATIGHGLGVAPALIIIKKTSAADNWAVYHAANPSPAASYALTLNSTSAAGLNTTYFNATAPTSTVFSVGTAAQTNTSGATYVAYCFATVDGYSKFGQFIGNGSATDGPFVYTGFKPKFVIVKRSVGAVASWFMIDTSRDSYNLTQSALYSNLANAQATSSFGDVLSNGFKIKSTAGELNTNGSTYVYIAFAENPFKYARAS